MTIKDTAKEVAENVLRGTHFTTVIQDALEKAYQAGERASRDRLRNFLAEYHRLGGDQSVVIKMILEELDRWEQGT